MLKIYQHIPLDLSRFELVKKLLIFVSSNKLTNPYTLVRHILSVNHIEFFFSWMLKTQHGDLQIIVSFCEAYIIKD